MLRAPDVDADFNTFMHWQSDLDFRRAIVREVPLPTTRLGLKAILEADLKDSPLLPFLVVCERPAEGTGLDSLGPGDDPFIKDGKARYPLIGFVTLRGRPASLANRNVKIGLAFLKEHQGAFFQSQQLGHSPGRRRLSLY